MVVKIIQKSSEDQNFCGVSSNYLALFQEEFYVTVLYKVVQQIALRNEIVLHVQTLRFFAADIQGASIY